MNNTLLAVAAGIGIVFAGCKQQQKTFDASGSFEAEEIIISAEASGVIMSMDAQEGKSVKAGEVIGYIDTIQLDLKKKQLSAQLKAIGSRMPDINAQTKYYNQQIEVNNTKAANLEKERQRFKKLVAGGAATQKQLDDIEAQLAELHKQTDVIALQKNAQESMLQTQVSGMQADPLPVLVQIEQVNDQLRKSIITNPVEGTILTQYARQYETTASGKPLYKVADLSFLIVRAYITGNQLPLIKINKQVKVFTDDGNGAMKQTTGTITWINDKAEFTPKTIQTKDERANMVYAVKVKVPNDGSYKIGMYGEIKFN